jgi:hypothetical protein
MIRAAVIAGAIAAFAAPLSAAAPGSVHAVPSGAEVTLIEVLSSDGWLRLRFLVPAIGSGALDFDAATADMLHLCRIIGLPMLQSDYPDAIRIMVSFADRALDFGVSDPAATQFFEGYSAADGDCIWEEF